MATRNRPATLPVHTTSSLTRRSPSPSYMMRQNPVAVLDGALVRPLKDEETKQELKSELERQARFQNEDNTMLGIPSGYFEGRVLMLSWHDEIDEFKDYNDEAASLQAVFQDQFNYHCQIERIKNRKNPQAELGIAISRYIQEHDGPNNLSIVYYAGHAKQANEKNGKRLKLLASQNWVGRHRPVASWDKAEVPFRNLVEGDILSIPDCCVASNAVLESRIFDTGTNNTRTYQLLAASKSDQPNNGPGNTPFTTALIMSLEELLDEHKDRGFPVTKIRDNSTIPRKNMVISPCRFPPPLLPLPLSHYRPAVDIVIVSADKTTWMNGYETDHGILASFDGPGRCQYSLEAIQRFHFALDDSSTDAKQPTRNPLCRLATHREHTQRATTPIIFVVQGSGRKKISQLLQSAHQLSTENPESISAVLNSIYGIISLPTPRRRPLLHTSLLATSQLICCAMIWNYEVCHGTPPKSCQTPWTVDLQPLPSALTPLLGYLQSPPTFLFVLLALTYGALATLQHHINQTDHLQGECLFVGIIAGALIAFPSLANPHEGLTLASPLAICITCALTFSAAAHWFWRTFLSPTRKRLEHTIDLWARETQEVNTENHVVKFHEII